MKLEFMKVIESKMFALEPSDGSRTLHNANIFSNFGFIRLNHSGPTKPAMNVGLYMPRVEDTLDRIFGSIEIMREYCLTQHQIVEFIEKYGEEYCGRRSSYEELNFLFEADGKILLLQVEYYSAATSLLYGGRPTGKFYGKIFLAEYHSSGYKGFRTVLPILIP